MDVDGGRSALQEREVLPVLPADVDGNVEAKVGWNPAEEGIEHIVLVEYLPVDKDGNEAPHEVKIDVVRGVLGDYGPYLRLPDVAEADDIANDDAPPLFEGEAALVGDFEHPFPLAYRGLVCCEDEICVYDLLKPCASAVQ